LRCLEWRGEEKTPIFFTYLRIPWRLEGSGAVSEAADERKRPEFTDYPGFVGVWEEAALPDN
jgi:hypothetical protein